MSANLGYECPMCHDDFVDRMTGYLAHSEIHDRFAMADLLLSFQNEIARLRAEIARRDYEAGRIAGIQGGSADSMRGD